MRALPLAVLLAACASSPSSSSSSSEPPPKPNGLNHVIYAGDREPPPEKMGILLVYSPQEESGKTFIGRIKSEATGSDYRPPMNMRYFHVEPGRYRIETYFWTAESRLENGKLRIENLQSGQIAPVEIVVDARRTYFIRADVRKKEAVPAEQRGAYFPLNYVSSGESDHLGPSDYVWRPEITAMTPAQERQYWSHP